MTICKKCLRSFEDLSSNMEICRTCIINDEDTLKIILDKHRIWRKKVRLPPAPPKSRYGVQCRFCVNECKIPPDEVGFCGIIQNRGGRLNYLFNRFDRAYLHYYYDPIPTNCVAAHICPASTGKGYPTFAVKPEVEEGYYNLAIFFAGCNLDCVFCQNIEHKYMLREKVGYGGVFSIKHLVSEAMNNRVTCICYFGGDPTPHIIFSLALSKEIHSLARKDNSVKRICWETNGLVNSSLFRKMSMLSFESGGIVKIDWKAYTPQIYTALTGIDGEAAIKRIKENIRVLKSVEKGDRGFPLLVVSTLVVPHYITADEVYGISSYLASIDSSIPLVLLAFAPHHLMRDTPTTRYTHMMECVNAAKEAGLENIHIGNLWLLR